MLNRILKYSFYLLFGLTPLIWYPVTSELFEFNKMIFVYILALIVLVTWIIKMIQSKQLLLKRTPLDLPLGLFLLANTISTFTSIDPHTSWWGYYSRSNGGFLSLISYLLLYYGLVSNFSKAEVSHFLKTALLGGLVVSLYAIPEHFGASPSCLILTGQADASCWVQVVQQRVFATLGQPNWLAAYLGMLSFPALYFALTSKTAVSKLLYTIYSILFYLAFTFTYSRGATLGLLAGVTMFAAVLTLSSPIYSGIQLKNKLKVGSVNWIPACAGMTTLILSIFLLINLLFGSALTNFSLIKRFASPTRASLTQAASGTQLESGGTESAKIRFIVWKGSLEIFKHYPFFGSGVETFAFSYYKYRPLEHNLTSEWDFLYNKAHNEFLNYLATTGIFGLGSYLAVLGTFIVWCMKYATPHTILIPALLASLLANAVTNFFGFSVVVTNLLMYLFPALAFVATDSTSQIKLSKRSSLYIIHHKLYSKAFYPKLSIVVVGVFLLLGLWMIYRFWLADTYYAQGLKANEAGSPGRAYNKLLEAHFLNPWEPLYSSELSFAAASSATALEEKDSSLSALLKDQANIQIERILAKHSANISLYRNAIRSYYLLSTIDKSYLQKTLTALDQAIALAPTDPKLTYNKAIIESAEGKVGEAILDMQKTIELKPDYRDAHYGLGILYFQQKQKSKAIEQMKQVLKINPQDSEAQEKLKVWTQ